MILCFYLSLTITIMNKVKNSLLAITIAVWCSWCNWLQKADTIADWKIVKDKYEKYVKSLEQHTDDTTKILFDTLDVANEKNSKIDSTKTQEDIEMVFSNKVETVHLDLIKNWPLLMRGTKRHIWEFLWYNQYEEILKKYNRWNYDENAFNQNFSITNFDSIRFPLIYDGLEKEMPETLDELMKNENMMPYVDSLWWRQDLIIVQKVWYQHALCYYKDGKLLLATHVSIWIWDYTPTWYFELWAKYPRNVSRKYRNAPMPYTEVISWNICLHQWKVTWFPLSHGCVRVPWLYQKYIYENSDIWTPIILFP